MIHPLKLAAVLGLLAATPALAAEPDPNAGHHPPPAAAPMPVPAPAPAPAPAPQKCPMMSGMAMEATKPGTMMPIPNPPTAKPSKGKMKMMAMKDMHCMPAMHDPSAQAPMPMPMPMPKSE